MRAHRFPQSRPREQSRHLTVDASDRRVMYAASYDGVYKTSDGGVNWSRISAFPAFQVTLEPKDSSVLLRGLGARSPRLCRKTDAGRFGFRFFHLSGRERRRRRNRRCRRPVGQCDHRRLHRVNRLSVARGPTRRAGGERRRLLSQVRSGRSVGLVHIYRRRDGVWRGRRPGRERSGDRRKQRADPRHSRPLQSYVPETIFASSGAGRTWTPVISAGEMLAIAFDPENRHRALTASKAETISSRGSARSREHVRLRSFNAGAHLRGRAVRGPVPER